MSIKEELLAEHSKKQTAKLVNYISDDRRKFAELMECFFSNDQILSSRAAWVMSYCGREHPFLLDGYLEKIIKNITGNVHVAVKRNTVRVLQHVLIPEKLRGMAATVCFDLIQSPTEPVAVKAFSMGVLSSILKHEPDLANEFKLIVEEQIPYVSAGFKSRAKKILKSIETGK